MNINTIKYFNNRKNKCFFRKQKHSSKQYRSRYLYLSQVDIDAISYFCTNYILSIENIKEKYYYSYPFWSKGSERCWNEIQQGGNGIIKILMWYHHIYKPNSKEFRVKIIIRSLLNFIKKSNY